MGHRTSSSICPKKALSVKNLTANKKEEKKYWCNVKFNQITNLESKAIYISECRHVFGAVS